MSADDAGRRLGAAMVEAHNALGSARYGAIVNELLPLAERDDNGDLTVEAMVRLATALDACTAVANMWVR